MSIDKSSLGFAFIFGACFLITLTIAGSALFVIFANWPIHIIHSMKDFAIFFLHLGFVVFSYFTIRQLINLFKLKRIGFKYFLVVQALLSLIMFILFLTQNEGKGITLGLAGLLTAVTIRLYNMYFSLADADN